MISYSIYVGFGKYADSTIVPSPLSTNMDKLVPWVAVTFTTDLLPIATGSMMTSNPVMALSVMGTWAGKEHHIVG